MVPTNNISNVLQAKYDVITSKIKSFVLARDPEAEVYLFGSQARGQATEDSDWDFFIATTTDDRSKLEDELLDPVVDILLDQEELVQYVVAQKKLWKSGATPSPLYDYIRQEAVLL